MSVDDQTPALTSGLSVLRIGRADDNETVVRDPLVSRYHVELRRSADGWVVRDLGSRHGTLLNGVRIHSAEARFGDTLRIGNSELSLDADGLRLLSSPVDPVQHAQVQPSPTVTPDRMWRWDGAQVVPNLTQPNQQGATEFGTPDGPTADGASSSSSTEKSGGSSLKVAAAALAVLGLVGVVAASVEGNNAGGSVSATTGTDAGDSIAPSDTGGVTHGAEADSAVEWAYMSGLWNAAPAATHNAVCRDFRTLGPVAFYEQTYLAYNPQPVHEDGRILSIDAHTDFHSQACTGY